MIIVLGGIKGGSGKTTVATNLAVLRALDKHEVLLIDADEQESAYTFAQVRSEAKAQEAIAKAGQPGDPGFGCVKLTGAAVGREAKRLSAKYEDIIIDTGGRDTTSQRSALSIAHLVLIPFKPRSLDVWTLGRVNQVMQEAQAVNPALKAATLLNQADARGRDNAEAAEILRTAEVLTFLEPALGHRKAFGNAAACGLAVTELCPLDEKAALEMCALYAYVFYTRDIYPLNAGHTAAAAAGGR